MDKVKLRSPDPAALHRRAVQSLSPGYRQKVLERAPPGSPCVLHTNPSPSNSLKPLACTAGSYVEHRRVAAGDAPAGVFAQPHIPGTPRGSLSPSSPRSAVAIVAPSSVTDAEVAALRETAAVATRAVERCDATIAAQNALIASLTERLAGVESAAADAAAEAAALRLRQDEAASALQTHVELETMLRSEHSEALQRCRDELDEEVDDLRVAMHEAESRSASLAALIRKLERRDRGGGGADSDSDGVLAVKDIARDGPSCAACGSTVWYHGQCLVCRGAAGAGTDYAPPWETVGADVEAVAAGVRAALVRARTVGGATALSLPMDSIPRRGAAAPPLSPQRAGDPPMHSARGVPLAATWLVGADAFVALPDNSADSTPGDDAQSTDGDDADSDYCGASGPQDDCPLLPTALSGSAKVTAGAPAPARVAAGTASPSSSGTLPSRLRSSSAPAVPAAVTAARGAAVYDDGMGDDPAPLAARPAGPARSPSHPASATAPRPDRGLGSFVSRGGGDGSASSPSSTAASGSPHMSRTGPADGRPRRPTVHFASDVPPVAAAAASAPPPAAQRARVTDVDTHGPDDSVEGTDSDGSAQRQVGWGGAAAAPHSAPTGVPPMPIPR